MALVGEHFAFVRAYETCRVIQNHTEPPDNSCTCLSLGFQSTSAPFPGQNVFSSEGSSLADFCSKKPPLVRRSSFSSVCPPAHMPADRSPPVCPTTNLGNGVGGGGGGVGDVRHVVARAPQP